MGGKVFVSNVKLFLDLKDFWKVFKFGVIK